MSHSRKFVPGIVLNGGIKPSVDWSLDERENLRFAGNGSLGGAEFDCDEHRQRTPEID